VGVITGETCGSPMEVADETLENGYNHGRSNATGINNTNENDGMQRYNSKTGYIEVRFMTGNSNGFNVTRALKQFLPAAREQDYEFTILRLAGIVNNLCIGADVPNSKFGIKQYFRHMTGLCRTRPPQLWPSVS
jgi:hypothetical protein